MIDKRKVKDLVLVSLVADSYSLGSHWVYDDKQLINAKLDWDSLNAPMAIWHKEKSAGDFTHYGDQTYWLYEFLENKEEFNKDEFLDFWVNKMKLYEGYIDGASRNTLENVQNNVVPSGSDSTDLSVVGRITPLLLVSKDKAEFLENVKEFTKLTHNSSKSINASKFFAKLLYLVLVENKQIDEAVAFLKDEFDDTIQGFIKNAIDSKDEDSFETIRTFGPACDVDEGFAGILHLLFKYDNLKDMLIQNAKAGGDTSARAMIASVIFMANKALSQVPQDWLAIKATIK